ncbi:type II toxin-antitoxin system VapC family toxin [Methylomonas sp. 2BW1-5-20]|uniref:type II toxin-antitoxin system VapC family toxin n=1 Tax=Methylomonas sp. 2BW1-5-20 TaxID=3376686 RepID=UPI00404F0196
MGFLIDTNVLSELRKKDRANTGVKQWFASVDGKSLYLSVLVIGEVRNGIERLRRRDPAAAENLDRWLSKVENDMAGRILPVTTPIADRWGQLNAPDPLPVIDSLLAATALEHDLTLVTRNVDDVQRSGVKLLNPFTD